MTNFVQHIQNSFICAAVRRPHNEAMPAAIQANGLAPMTQQAALLMLTHFVHDQRAVLISYPWHRPKQDQFHTLPLGSQNTCRKFSA